MSQARCKKRKVNIRLSRRIADYAKTVSTLKGNTEGYHIPGSNKK